MHSKKKIAEKETLVHMGGRGVKKSPFLSSSKRGHIPMEGGVKIFLSHVPYSISSFCLHSICSISWVVHQLTYRKFYLSLLLEGWKGSVKNFICPYSSGPFQTRGVNEEWEWTHPYGRIAWIGSVLYIIEKSWNKFSCLLRNSWTM